MFGNNLPHSCVLIFWRSLALLEVFVPLALTCCVSTVKAIVRAALVSIYYLEPTLVIIPRVERIANVYPFVKYQAIREVEQIRECKGTRFGQARKDA